MEGLELATGSMAGVKASRTLMRKGCFRRLRMQTSRSTRLACSGLLQYIWDPFKGHLQTLLTFQGSLLT